METESLVRYSIVVPFFNEQENIPALYMKLTEVMDAIGEPYELVFVDDGSKDNSFKVLSDIYEHDRRVNLIRLRRNFGQTPALKAGFDFARGAFWKIGPRCRREVEARHPGARAEAAFRRCAETGGEGRN